MGEGRMPPADVFVGIPWQKRSTPYQTFSPLDGGAPATRGLSVG